MPARVDSLLPEQFGPLQGVRILSTGTIVAQPFAAALAAEMGAEVIQIERPVVGDVTRGIGVQKEGEKGPHLNSLWLQDRRNTFSATLDFSSREGRELFLRLIPSVDIWNLEKRQEYLKDLRSVDPNVTGSAVHMFNSTRLMTEGYINGGIYAMTAIVIYVFIVFRNLRTVFFILIPVFAGSIWTLGIMDLAGLKLNMANLVILPLILGIGVVNGIHITHRYREEKDKNQVVLSKSTGQAVILSSLTTMIGFGSMVVADHYGVYSLGLVLSLGVFCCLIASITFLPALLKLSNANKWKV